MNDPSLNPTPAQDLGRAALLRCAADGELTPQQQAALEAHLAVHPGDEARIRFERQLRSACARAMAADEVAPAHLRTLIAARISGSAVREGAPEPALALAGTPAEDEREPAIVVGRIGPGWLHRWSYAAAAVLLAGVGISLLVRAGFLTQQAEATDAVVVLSSFLADEHNRFSASPDALASKLKVTEITRVRGAVQQILGKPVSIESMEEAGFEFIGAGSCRLPGSDRSMHLVFRRTDGRRAGAPVSLFIEPDIGRLNLEEGVTYAVEEGCSGRASVLAWTSNGLVYYLVTKCANSCDAAKDTLEAPQSLAGLAR